MVRVTVKWNKSVFDSLDLDTTQSVAVFKAKLRELTNVPESRQKLMAKGCWAGTLKDDQDLSQCKISEGAQILLMGTAEVVAPSAATATFIEDLTADEIAQKGAVLPAGLDNLGNTCYLNSTLQCLRSLSDLRPVFQRSGSGLTSALFTVLQQLDNSGKSVAPYQFIQTLRRQFPQFAEMQQGRYMQQDAEELYSALLSSVPPDQLASVLSVELEETLNCNESNEERAVVNREIVNKLICNIRGGPGSTIQIDHLIDGLKLGMESTIEKRSEVLGRDATWTRVQRIASLPKFLCIQFMRFFWKATPESRDHAGLKCKILRPVKFPEVSDNIVSGHFSGEADGDWWFGNRHSIYTNSVPPLSKSTC